MTPRRIFGTLLLIAFIGLVWLMKHRREGDGENDSTVSPSHTEERVRVENRLVLNGNL